MISRPQPKPERWIPGVVCEIEKRKTGWLYSVSYEDLSAKEQNNELPAKTAAEEGDEGRGPR